MFNTIILSLMSTLIFNIDNRTTFNGKLLQRVFSIFNKRLFTEEQIMHTFLLHNFVGVVILLKFIYRHLFNVYNF